MRSREFEMNVFAQNSKNENSLLNSEHQLWQDNIQKPGFWQF
jgi:hypothetical protein